MDACEEGVGRMVSDVTEPLLVPGAAVNGDTVFVDVSVAAAVLLLVLVLNVARLVG